MSTLKDKIVIASSNKGKIKEFQSYFDSFGLILIPQKEMGVSDIEETGKTYVENSILKARHASKVTDYRPLQTTQVYLLSIWMDSQGSAGGLE